MSRTGTPAKARRRTKGARLRDTLRKQRKPDHFQSSMKPGTKIESPFRPLSDHEVHKIHQASLDLLERVGMAEPTPRVREFALAGGCLQGDNGRLLFPRGLVEDMLSCAATEFVVHGRDSAFDFEAKCGTVNFCTGGAAVQMLDIDSRQYRPSTLQDLYDLARICDTLENIQWFTRPIVATDLEDLYELDINTVFACAAGTQKHIASSITEGEHVYKMLPMLDLLGGGQGVFAKRPFMTVHATNVVSPLTFAADSLDVTCAAVDIGMPIHAQTGPQAGATAPAALAGTLVQACAESLASVTIINILKPGHPVIIGNWVFVSDLRTGAFSGGGGEQALLGAGAGQMANFYGIPGGCGAGMTDSKLPDNQAGFEKATTLLSAALSGGGMVYESAGMLASLLGCSFESMIMDDDFLSSIRRIARGIEVTDETISVSVIEDAVLGPGHFLGHDQTMQLMESEYAYPNLADRKSPDEWMEGGSKDCWDRASERAKDLLSSHSPWYIDAQTNALIRDSFPIRLSHPGGKCSA